MRNLLLPIFLILSISSSLFGQNTFTSTCGYSLTVYIKPDSITLGSINGGGGYSYGVRFHYDIVVNGTSNCGSNLYTFQVVIKCLLPGNSQGNYSLPKNLVNSSGTLFANNNQQAHLSNGIAYGSATPRNFACNEIFVTVEGPGISGTQIQKIIPGALPIELISFDATANQNQVDLSWMTGSEKNNDFFTIERTVDGIVYEEVTKIEGQGNSSSKTSYEYTDARPLSGISYYRLKQTDYNGESEVFEVKSVNIERGELVSNVYPNPTAFNKTTVFIAQTNANVTVNVRNILGQILFSKEVDSKSHDVYEEIELTESGQIFVVEIVKDKDIIARHKVLKN
ncbi:MAG: T9SS type A sorting domain-containing protein [Crocinitomicaceae bacterium]|nr:T9SS type A sorting domain-containing protein [Crocinitomicaceae bacterium]